MLRAWASKPDSLGLDSGLPLTASWASYVSVSSFVNKIRACKACGIVLGTE